MKVMFRRRVFRRSGRVPGTLIAQKLLYTVPRPYGETFNLPTTLRQRGFSQNADFMADV